MPEALGGGYPIKPAVIKDESGNIISDTHQQPGMLEKGKETITQLVSGTPIGSLIGVTPVKEFVQPGPVVDVSVPHSEIPTLPVAQERLLAVDTSNTFLGAETYQPLATERLLYVETGPSTMTRVTGTVQSVLGGATETAKGLYREHMPEVLGGRAPTFMEKVHGHTTGTSLVGKVKALASETLPESFGGRAPTLTEKLTAAPSIVTKAKILKEETMGKPVLKEKVETHQPSLLTLAKETYKSTMPEALGGRPSLKENVPEYIETETVPTETSVPLLERAKHTLKQNLPEALGGGYPVQAGIIRDTEGNLIKVTLVKVNEETGEVVEETPSESLVERAKHTLKQVAPEALGGGYPVHAAIIKDEHGNVVSNRPAGILEKVKEYLPTTLGGTTETGPSESLVDRAKHTIKQHVPVTLGGGYPVQAGIIQDENGNVTEKPSEFQSDLDVWKSQQPSLLQRAKHTFKETAPEALGGRPAQEGETTFAEKAKEKLGEVKERIHPSTASTSATTQPGGLLELMKQTVTEVIPEMIGLKSIPEDQPEIKHDTIRAVDRTEAIPQVDRTEATPQVDRDIQEVRVVEEIRTVDMDEAGHVTQVEAQQKVSHIPVIVKDIPVEQTQKAVDIPINEQPILDVPLADNYEFQGQSVPAPHSQKVPMPSPQIMISPEYVQQHQHQESFH
jgi:hypothetical protein